MERDAATAALPPDDPVSRMIAAAPAAHRCCDPREELIPAPVRRADPAPQAAPSHPGEG